MKTQEELEIEIRADPKKAIQGIDRLQREISKNMKKAQDSIEDADKGFSRFMETKTTRARTAAIKELTDQYKALDAVVKKTQSKPGGIGEMSRQMRKTTKAGSPERKAAMAAISTAKAAMTPEEKKQRTEELKNYRQARRTQRGVAKGLQGAGAMPSRAAGYEIANNFADALKKDAPGLMKDLAKELAKAMGSKSKSFGASLAAHGQEVSKGGGLKGAVTGGAALAGGGLLKAFGGLTEVISKIGPALSLVAGGLMSFVKLLLDAEAAAKDYNRQILATSGTSSYLNRNMGDVTKASEALDASLNAARKGAINLDNVMWGITKETAIAFQSALTAEGVALDRLGNATASVAENQAAHTRTIQMGVAYSRAFGVSLNEIAQLQGQLMADLGMGAQSVQLSFQTIVDSSHDAGIETNKFFGIIRSFSSDLNLFTLRLADVSKIMGVLGKTMDPRKMGQFLQTLNQKFSGGIVENLKFNEMAGPEHVKIQMDDMATKMQDMAVDIGGALGKGNQAGINELTDILKNPTREPRAIAKWAAKYKTQLEGKGAVVEKLQELANLQTKLQSGNKLDQAAVLSALSPISKLKQFDAIARHTFKSEGIEGLSGEQLTAFETAGVASVEQVEMFKRFKQGIMQGQENLLKSLQEDKISEGDAEKIAKMVGIAIPDAKTDAAGHEKARVEAAAKLDQLFHDPADQMKGMEAYLNSADKTEQERLKAMLKEANFQKDTAKFQTSILGQIDQIYDVLINQLYDVMRWILDAIQGYQTDLEEARSLSAGTKNSELVQVFSKAKDYESGLAEAKRTVMPKAWQKLQDSIAHESKLKEDIEKTTNPDDKKALQKELAELTAAIDPLRKYAKLNSAEFGDQLYLDMRGGDDEDIQAGLETIAAGLKLGGVTSTAAEGSAVVPTATGAASPMAASDQQKEAKASSEKLAQSSQNVERAVSSDGVKLNPISIRGPLADTMAESVYQGTAKALFEYFMYSGLDRPTVATALGKGVDRTAIAQGVAGTSGMAPNAVLAKLIADAGGVSGNALGGTVTGIRGGMAQVSRFPAPGEGWASVGRGEKILPAGSGGGGGQVRVELAITGDFKRFVEARVVEGAATHERNRRLR